MLKFINKQGNKVMELKDNGELNVLNEELKASFELKNDKELKTKETPND